MDIVLLQLIVLFVVIFDPLASFAVFFVATEQMQEKEKKKIAVYAILVAAAVSYFMLFFGEKIFFVFNTTLDDFRIAGGIILTILGIKMALGQPLAHIEKHKGNSGRAVAAIIGTPLLTGPAAITTIFISVQDFGILPTFIAVTIVLAASGLLLYYANRLQKLSGKTMIQIISTILGLITMAWGIKFIRAGFRI
jgi:multiple antibiotic resistance protein